MKHTAAPWYLTDNCGNLRFTVLRRGAPSSTMQDLDFGNEEDAALCAGAPEMYEVLKLLESYVSERVPMSRAYMLGLIRTAIAKVEGPNESGAV